MLWRRLLSEVMGSEKSLKDWRSVLNRFKQLKPNFDIQGSKTAEVKRMKREPAGVSNAR
jgi:hypothetical protein